MSSMEAEDTDGETPAVKEFCVITGATVQRARYMLEACNSDLELALNLQLEGGDLNRSLPLPPAVVVEEEKVRAPDLPRQDVLVDTLAAHNMNRGTTTKRNGGPSAMSVFDSFRDFQVEARRQEEMLREPRPTRAHVSKIRRLEDLFRPPLEMIFHGSFQMARDFGVGKNKWLMVNPQDSTEFSCQVLNRDIWSDAAIKSIVEEHFVFWQVYADSNEGQQYNQYYRVDQYPYVSVVDPRTGELLKKWHVIEKPFFAEQLLHFLQDHPLPSPVDVAPEACRRVSKLQLTPKKQATVTSETQKISESAMVPRDDVFPNECNPRFVKDSCAKKTVNGEKHTIISSTINTAQSDLDDSFNFDYESGDCLYDSSTGSEKSTQSAKSTQSNKATKSSKRTKSDKGTKSDNKKIAKFDKGTVPDKATKSPSTSQPAEDSKEVVLDVCDISEPHLLTTLSLRFPDSHREIVKFPSSSKIKALQTMLEGRGFPANKFHYMTYFPKRKLSSSDVSEDTFTTLGIVHNETIFIHACDKDNTA